MDHLTAVRADWVRQVLSAPDVLPDSSWIALPRHWLRRAMGTDTSAEAMVIAADKPLTKSPLACGPNAMPQQWGQAVAAWAAVTDGRETLAPPPTNGVEACAQPLFHNYRLRQADGRNMLATWDDGADGWRLWLRCGVTTVGDIIELGSGREETAGTLIQRAWRRALRVSPVRLLHSAPAPTVDDVGALTRVLAGRTRPLQRLQQAVRRAGWTALMRRGHAGVHHDGWYITDEDDMVTPIRYRSTTGEWELRRWETHEGQLRPTEPARILVSAPAALREAVVLDLGTGRQAGTTWTKRQRRGQRPPRETEAKNARGGGYPRLRRLGDVTQHAARHMTAAINKYTPSQGREWLVPTTGVTRPVAEVATALGLRDGTVRRALDKIRRLAKWSPATKAHHWRLISQALRPYGNGAHRWCSLCRANGVYHEIGTWHTVAECRTWEPIWRWAQACMRRADLELPSTTTRAEWFLFGDHELNGEASTVATAIWGAALHAMRTVSAAWALNGTAVTTAAGAMMAKRALERQISDDWWWVRHHGRWIAAHKQRATWRPVTVAAWARQWQGLARPRRGTGTGFEHTVPGKVTARQLRAAAAAQGDTVRRVAEHTGMDDTSDPSEDESEARGTSEVGSGTDEEDEREDASGGAHGGTA